MKIELDENLGVRGQQLLAAAGHDVCTGPAQALTAADDRHLIDVCRREGRALVTLDVDFANPLAYPPGDYPGIAVLRIPKRATAADPQAGLLTLARALETETLAGRLRIVERGCGSGMSCGYPPRGALIRSREVSTGTWASSISSRVTCGFARGATSLTA